MTIVEVRGGPVTVPKLLKKSRHEIARQCVEALDWCDKLTARAEKAEAERDAWRCECDRLRGMLRRLIEPPEASDPMSADDILARLAEHRQTHSEWASWFEMNPDDPRVQGGFGDAAFHREVEATYDRMIAGVERLKAAAGARQAMQGGSDMEIAGLMTAINDVIAERQRQVRDEGWSPEHDDAHVNGEMAGAAACYALYRSQIPPEEMMGEALIEMLWPWAPEWWKPKDRRRDLVRAAALIIAEIERLDRAAKRNA